MKTNDPLPKMNKSQLKNSLEVLLHSATVHQWARQTLDLLEAFDDQSGGPQKKALRELTDSVLGDAKRNKEEYAACLVLAHRLGRDPSYIIDRATDVLTGKLQHRDFHFLCEYLFPDRLPLPETLIYDITSRIIFDLRDHFERISEGFKRVPKKNGNQAILYLTLELCRADLNQQNRDFLFIILSRIQLPIPARLAAISNLNLERIRGQLMARGLKDLEILTLAEEEPDRESAGPTDVPLSSAKASQREPLAFEPRPRLGDQAGSPVKAAGLPRQNGGGQEEGGGFAEGLPPERRPAGGVRERLQISEPDLSSSRQEEDAYEFPTTQERSPRRPGADADADNEKKKRGPGYRLGSDESEERPAAKLDYSGPAVRDERGAEKSKAFSIPSPDASPEKGPEFLAEVPRKQRSEAELTDDESQGIDLGSFDDLFVSGREENPEPLPPEADEGGGILPPEAEEKGEDTLGSPAKAGSESETAAKSDAEPEDALDAEPAKEVEGLAKEDGPEPEPVPAEKKPNKWKLLVFAGAVLVGLLVLLFLIFLASGNRSDAGPAREGIPVERAPEAATGSLPDAGPEGAPALGAASDRKGAADGSAISQAAGSYRLNREGGGLYWTVSPGENFWGLFLTLRADGRASGSGGPAPIVSWLDFLVRIRTLNSLSSPDLVFPGVVYKIE